MQNLPEFDEDSVDGTAITLPSGLSIELPRDAVTALMQTSFAFDQKPVFNSSDAMVFDHGAVIRGPTLESGDRIAPSMNDWKINPETSLKNGDHEASISKNADSTNAAHANEIDTSPNVVPDPGVLKVPASGNGNRSITSDASEHARSTHDVGVRDLGPSSPAQGWAGDTAGKPGDAFRFKDDISGNEGSGVNGAKLNDISVPTSHHEDATVTHGSQVILEAGKTSDTLGDSFHFKDWISSPKGSTVTDLAVFGQIPASSSDHNAAVALLAISDGAQAIGLPQLGQHSDDHFNSVLDHAPGAPATHVPHDLIV